jgi:hypothetical protein
MSSDRSSAKRKSFPRVRKALTGAAGPRRRFFNTKGQLRPVRSGFCSEPERANSLFRVRRSRTNQLQSNPVPLR